MNFYKAQDDARKQTIWLLVLFTIAVTALILLTNFCVAFFVLYSNPEFALNGRNPFSETGGDVFQWFQNLVFALGWKKFLWTSLLVVGVLFMAMFFKWLALREGGRVVAESLGGRPILTNTTNNKEKRLLNVVEEMALAAGIPAPQVFLLEKEMGINAFAAGLSIEDAVIGVTQGSLNAFNRDQLQGVIAHEFSHILNGDMRLNMNLLVVLHGILMISESGHMMMRLSSSQWRHTGRTNYRNYGSNRNGGVAAGLFAFGLCLWVLGSIGQLFGVIIKSAVSRQREFLADASAVQFTRNPNGIGEALSLIGGFSDQSRVVHHGAHEMSHLFFSRIGSPRKYFTQFFATHPPLEERIRRVLPRWNGSFLQSNHGVEQDDSFGDMVSSLDSGANTSAFQSSNNDSSVQQVGEPIKHEPIEFELVSSVGEGSKSAYEALLNQAHEPSEAPALMCAILIDNDKLLAEKQLELVCGKQDVYKKVGGGDLSGLVSDILVLLKELNPRQTLGLVELLIPSFKLVSLEQYRVCRSIFVELIHSDGKVDLFEWLIFQLLKQHCDRHFGLSQAVKPKYKDLNKLLPLYQIVLSRIVYYGESRALDACEKAFRAGCEAAGIKSISLLPINECQQGRFTQAVHHLGLAYPLLKPRLLKGLYAAANSDEVVTARQDYLIKGVAAVMDCPFNGGGV